jgi:hypothetical protein
MSKKVKKSLRDRLELAQVEAESAIAERDAFAALLSAWWWKVKPAPDVWKPDVWKLSSTYIKSPWVK